MIEIFDKFGRPTKDANFMTWAFLAAQRSLDPNTKHGCVAVSDDDAILSTGYNSPPRNCDDSKIPLTRPEKYDYMVHSEANCIGNAAREGLCLKNSTFYITGFPCARCFGEMLGAGVKKIIYGNVGSHMINEDMLRAVDLMNTSPDGSKKIQMVNCDIDVRLVLDHTRNYVSKKIYGEEQ